MIAQRQIAMKWLVVSYMRNFKSHLNRITEMRQKSRSKSSVSENEPQCVGGAAHFAYYEVLEDINVVMTNDLFFGSFIALVVKNPFYMKTKIRFRTSPPPTQKKKTAHLTELSRGFFILIRRRVAADFIHRKTGPRPFSKNQPMRSKSKPSNLLPLAILAIGTAIF